MCPPQIQTAEEIEKETQLVYDEFTKRKTEYDQINGVATEQKKQEKISDLVTGIIDKDNHYQNLSTEGIWIEDDMQNDKGDIVNISKDILKILRKTTPFQIITPTDVIIKELFDDVELTIDEETTDEGTIEDVTHDETNKKVTIADVTDDKSFVVNNDDFKEPEEIEAEMTIVDWDPKNTSVSENTRPRTYMTTKYGSAIRATNKIKNKYNKKKNLAKRNPITIINLRKRQPNGLKGAMTDMRYFARSKFSRSLANKRNFSLIWQVVLGYLF